MIAKYITHITLLICLNSILFKIIDYICYLCDIPQKGINVVDLYNNYISMWIITICFIPCYYLGFKYISKFINFIKDK